jgi:crossover junction endodeoxyribonuclease RusA
MAIIGLEQLKAAARKAASRHAEQRIATLQPSTTGGGIALPWPPSVNTCYRVYQNRILLSREGRRYKELVHQHLAARGCQPLECKLSVYIDAYPPDKRRRDLGNLDKALMDACQGYLFKDDSQIDLLHIERQHVEPHGKVVVRVEARP